MLIYFEREREKEGRDGEWGRGRDGDKENPKQVWVPSHEGWDHGLSQNQERDGYLND